MLPSISRDETQAKLVPSEFQSQEIGKPWPAREDEDLHPRDLNDLNLNDLNLNGNGNFMKMPRHLEEMRLLVDPTKTLILLLGDNEPNTHRYHLNTHENQS